MTTDIVTLCHAATIANNQISLLGAFDSIYAKSLPLNYPPFTVVVRACFTSEEIGDHQLILRIVDPDGRNLGEMTINLSLSKESFDPRFTLSISFPITGMELRCYGDYAVDLLLDGEEPIRTIFQVKPVPAHAHS